MLHPLELYINTTTTESPVMSISISVKDTLIVYTSLHNESYVIGDRHTQTRTYTQLSATPYKRRPV